MVPETRQIEELAKFDSPPVIETVLSLQFEPLENYSDAHAGWYWKNYLSTDWDEIVNVPRVQDKFERFADERKWTPHGGQLLIQTQPSAERYQILRVDKQRMLQVQNSRFILNWRRGGDGEYPTYEKLKPEFMEHYENFKIFVADSGNEEIKPNQWEVTYVNQIIKGELWESLSDISKIFPWISFPAEGVADQVTDGYDFKSTLTIGANLGRLYISLKHARIGSDQGAETLILEIIARGPVSEEKGINFEDGFDIGHIINPANNNNC